MTDRRHQTDERSEMARWKICRHDFHVSIAHRSTIKVNTDIRTASNNVNGTANEATSRRKEKKEREINNSDSRDIQWWYAKCDCVSIIPSLHAISFLFSSHSISSYLLLLHFSACRIIEPLLSISVDDRTRSKIASLSLLLIFILFLNWSAHS